MHLKQFIPVNLRFISLFSCNNDKNETWVTLWYTEVITDKKGKVDSIYYTDDVLVKNEKILVYDEKQRQFPSAKKMQNSFR